MTKIIWAALFKELYKSLPASVKGRVKKQLHMLQQNPRHPSLNIKKMNDPRNIWEGRITRSYRFTFHVEDDVYILRKVGTHDILKKP